MALSVTRSGAKVVGYFTNNGIKGNLAADLINPKFPLGFHCAIAHCSIPLHLYICGVVFPNGERKYDAFYSHDPSGGDNQRRVFDF
jgi:hypothetical protein